MGGRLAVTSAIALIALLLTSSTVTGAPPLVTDTSIDGDVDLNNRVRSASSRWLDRLRLSRFLEHFFR